MKITRKWLRAWRRHNHQTRLHASRPRNNGTAVTKAKQPKKSFVRRIVPRGLRPLAAAAGVMLAVLTSQPGAQAMPAGGEVTGGSGNVQTNGTTMTVTQTSDKMAINWQQFNIAQNETVRFNQPSASSVALNRVVTNEGSVIAGRLSANGRVIVTNPNGVVFSPTAQVEVGGIVASSLHISDADFMNGRYVFNKTGANMGEVINQGTITAADGGYVVLLGDKVVNEGVIVANKGSVALAAGGGVTLDFSGDGLVNLAVSQSAMDALAENKNLIQADGGKVIMTARAAGDLVTSVVNNSGVIRARGISEKNGRIILDGGAVIAGGTIDASNANGKGGAVVITATKLVDTSGEINVSGTTGGSIIVTSGQNIIQTVGSVFNATGSSGAGGIVTQTADCQIYTSGTVNAGGATGGRVDVSAPTVYAMGAAIDASGTTGGGGVISIGGGWQGTLVNNRPNADYVYVGPGSVITAHAGETGTGGTITVWSEQQTVFGGDLGGSGGRDNSPGGALEVSARDALTFGGCIVPVYGRQSPSLLLDPKNITISASGGGITAIPFADPNTNGTQHLYGHYSVGLANGNVVVTSPYDDALYSKGGAVYMFNGTTYALIATLRGDMANAQFGYFLLGLGNPVIVLDTGNFLVRSYGNGATGSVTYGGSVTPVNAATGATLSGSGAVTIVSTANTLSGIGTYTPLKLAGGDLVFTNPGWNSTRGAVTQINGSVLSGGDTRLTYDNTLTISAANSLVGSTAGDQVGYGNNTIAAVSLANGNYAVASGSWQNPNGTTGAVTVMKADGSTVGAVSTANSLTIASGDLLKKKYNSYSSYDDFVNWRLIPLVDGNLVVANPGWTHPLTDYDKTNYASQGAVTWLSGTTGLTYNGTRTVSAANSLVGDITYNTGSYDPADGIGRYGDNVGLGDIVALTGANSGKYVVGSPRRGNWDNSTIKTTYYTWPIQGGAATLCAAGGGTVGKVSASNSIVGPGRTSTGSSGSAWEIGDSITALTDGNYVIGVPAYNTADQTADGAGAAVWLSGATGKTIKNNYTIDATTALVGVKGDGVGYSITALANGRYAVTSPFWDGDASVTNGYGAVTFGTAGGGTVGLVTADNSLTGSHKNDMIGYNAYIPGQTVTVLANGNYVVASPSWNGAMGAVTLVNGATGYIAGTSSKGGVVSSANSLVGTAAGDNVGQAIQLVTYRSSVYELTDGNFVVVTPTWSASKGAVTWVNGSTGALYGGAVAGGTLSAANSLTGTGTDMVGCYGGIDSLAGGDYLVRSPMYSSAGYTIGGALTWAKAGGMTVGSLTSANSFFGAAASGYVGMYSTTRTYVLPSGKLLVSHAFPFSGTVYEFVRVLESSPPEVALPQYYSTDPSAAVSIKPATITAVLNAGTALTLQANSDITVKDAVTAANSSGNGGALTLQAGRSILINANITTDNGAFTAIANDNLASGVVNAQRTAGDAVITMADGVSVNAGSGAATFDLRPGTGLSYNTSGDVTLGTVTASSLTVKNQGPGNGAISLGATTLSGNLSVTGSGGISQTGTLSIGGTADLTAGSANNITLTTAANDFGGGIRIVSGKDVSLTDKNALVLGNANGASAVSGNLTVTGSGAITQAGAVSVTGTTDLTAGAVNNITLTTATNDFGGGIRIVSGKNVSLTDTNAMILGNANGSSTVSGTLTVIAGGALTQAGTLSVTGTTDITAGSANSITLTNSANDFTGGVRIVSGKDVSLTDAGAIVLGNANGASAVSGNLVVAASGAVTQAGALSVGGTTSLTAGSANNITLTNSANDFTGGIRIVSGKDVSLTDASAIVLGNANGASAVSGNLVVAASGAVTQASALAVTGTTDLTAGSTNNITLANSANNFTGGVRIVSGNDVSLRDANALVLGNAGGSSAVSGTLTVVASGAVTQAGALSVSGTTDLTVGSANSITLTDSANNFTGGIRIVSGKDVSLTDTNALVLGNAGGASAVSGNLVVIASGAVTQDGALSVTGTTDLTAGSANSITLTNSANNFTGGVRVVSGKNVSLTDANALVLGNANGASAVSGNLVVAVGGAVTQAGDLSVTGTTDLTAGSANNITLTNAANNFTGGVRIVSGKNVSLTDTNAIVLGNAGGASAVSGNLVVNAGGAVTQAGALSVSGTTDLTAGSANNITLTNSANDFTGGVRIVSGYAVSLTDTNAIVLSNANGASTVSGGLIVSAAGTITQAAALTVSGNTTLTAGSANNITLANSANDFTGGVRIVSGKDVSLTDASAIVLGNSGGASAVSGNLVVAASGAITQAGTLSVTGTTDLTAGSANNITLTNSANDFTGGIRIVSGNNVSLRDANALVLGNSGGASAVSGSLTVTASGAITQATALTVGGTTTLTAGSANNITLSDESNAFTGGIRIVSGKDATLTNSLATVLGNSGGSSTVSGFLTVSSAGNVTQAGTLTVSGNLTVGSSGTSADILLGSYDNVMNGSVTFTGASIRDITLKNLTTGSTTVSLPAAGLRNLTLTESNESAVSVGSATLSGNASIQSGGGIGQSGAWTVAGTTSLTAPTTGTITLTNSANRFTDGVRVVSGGDVSLTDSAAFLLGITNGASVISGKLTAVANGAITQAAALTVTGTTDLTAGDANNITLDNGANNFGGGVRIVSGKDVSLNDANAIVLGNAGGVSTVSGALTVNAGGAVTDAGTFTVNGLLTVNAGANDVTWGGAGRSTYFGSLNVTGGAVSVSETDAMHLTGLSATAATLTAGGSLTVADNLTITRKSAADNSFTFQAAGDIVFGTGATLQTTDNKMNVYLRANSGGSGGAVVLGPDVSILTNGGDVWLGGVGTNAARGNATYANGVLLDGAVLNAGGGTIDIRGTAANAADSAGVYLTGSSTLTTGGAGSISITGTGGTNAASRGIVLDGNTLTVAEGQTVTLNGASQSSGAGAYALLLQTAPSTVNGSLAVSASGNAVTQTADAPLTVTGSAAFATGTSDLLLNAAADNALQGTVSVSSGANVRLLNATALTLGAVSTSGVVDIATKSGDLSLTGAVTTTDATGSAIRLTAGGDSGVGVATGGNITIGDSASVSVGTGGTAVLYTGSISSSTGLTTLVGSGSGRFRYNSTATTSNFTTPIGTGVHAVYREQPTLTIIADDKTIEYSGDTTPTVTLAGLQNGDTQTQALSSNGTVTVGGTNSTSGKPVVGDHALTMSEASGGLGYALTYASGTLRVTAKPLTAQYTGVAKEYDGNTTATVTNTTTGVVTGDAVTFSQTVGAFADKNAGDNKPVAVSGITITGTDAGNYTLLNTTATAVGGITRREATLTGAANVDKTYDGTTAVQAATPYGALGNLVTDDKVSVTGVTVYDEKNAGSRSVQQGSLALSGADAGNYTLKWTNGSGTINKASLTMTAVHAEKLIGETDPAFTATYSGFVNGETAAVLTTPTVTRSNSNVNEAGTYNGVLVPTATAANYTITAVSGNFIIHPAGMLLIGLSDQSKTYGTGLPEFTATSARYATVTEGSTSYHTVTLTSVGTNQYTYSDGLGTSGSFDLTTTGTATSNIGNYAINVSNFTKTGSNFTDWSAPGANLLVTPLQVSVAVGGVSKVYDGTTAMTNLALSVGNKVVTDTVAISGIGTYANKNAGTGKDYTVSNLSLTNNPYGNYSLTASSVTGNDGVITAKPITVTYAAANKVYDGTTAAIVAASSAGVISGDKVAFSQSAVFADKNAATGKTVNISAIALSGDDKDNYSLSATTATAAADIAKRTLIISAVHDSKVYDGQLTSSATPTASGIQTGDSINGLVQAYTDKNAGTGTKTLQVSGTSYTITDGSSSDMKDNYTVSLLPYSTGTITPKPLTPGLTGTVEKVYNGTTAATLTAGNYALKGVIAADDGKVTAGGTGAAYDSKHVGEDKLVTVTGLVLSGDEKANYTLVTATTASGAIGVITPKPITVTPGSSQTMVYNGAAPTPTLTYTTNTDLAAGDSFTGALALTSPSRNAGDYAISQGTLAVSDGNSGKNYALTLASGVKYKVTPAPLTISAVTDTKVYDRNTTSSALPTVNGLLSTDTVTDLVQAYTDRNAGSGDRTLAVTAYTVNDGNSGSNYNVSTVSYTQGTITPKPLTPGLTGTVEKVYDGTTAATLAAGNYTLSGIITGDTVAAGGTGTYDTKHVNADANTKKTVTVSGLTLDGTAKNNYTLGSLTTVSADIGVITPKAITVTPDSSQTTVYNGAVPDPVLSYKADTVLAAGDSFAGALALTDPTRHVGNYAISKNTLGINDGNDGSNYIFTFTSGVTYAVTPKALTAAYTAQNKTYDGTTGVVVTGTSGDLVDIDTVTFSQTAAFANRNAGTGKTVNITGITLGGADAGNYVLQNSTASTTADIAQRSLTITAVTDTKTYDRTVASSAIPTVNGLQDVDSVTALAQEYDSKNVAAGTKTLTVKAYTVNDGNSGSNYAVTTVPVTTGTITPKAVTPGLTGTVEKVYDGNVTATLTAANYSLSGFISGDTVTVSGTATYDTRHVDTAKMVSVGSLALSGTDAGNYILDTDAASAAIGVITPKTLTVTPGSNQTAVYSGRIPSPTLSYASDGLVGSDSLTGSLALTDATRNVGSYAINQGTLAVSDDNGGKNYTISLAGGVDFAVTPRPLTITALTDTKTYDGTVTSSVTPEFTGRAFGDTLSAVQEFATKNAGSNKTIKVASYTLSDGNNGNNYTVTTQSDTTGVITKKDITAALTGSVDKVYDSTNVATLADGSYVLPGVVSGDAVTLYKPTYGTYDDKTVGTWKMVTVNGLTISGADAGNYNLTTEVIGGPVGNITAATLTYNATPVSRFQGQPNPTFTGTVTGFAGADTQDTVTMGTLVFTNTTGLATPPGRYAVTGSGLTAIGGNYVFVQNSANATALRIDENEKSKSAVKVTDDHSVVKPPEAPKAPDAPVIVPPGGIKLVPGKSEGTPSGGQPGNGGTPSSTTPAAAPAAPSNITITPTGGQGASYGLQVSSETVTISSVGDKALSPAGQTLTVVAPDQNVSYHSTATNGSSLSLGTVAAPPAQALPPQPEANAAAATGKFQMNGSDGSVAEFRLTYANGALAIQPLNETAAAMSSAQGAPRTILVAAGMMAAAEKMGVPVGDVAAVYVAGQ